MTNKYDYEIFQEKSLIVKYFQGIISIAEFITFNNRTLFDTRYDPTMCVMNDVRNTEFIFTDEDLKKFIGYVQSNVKMYGKRKVAFLTNTPNQTVFTILLDFFKNDKMVTIKTFTTLPATVEWLQLSLADMILIENCIEKLKRNLIE
jgi:hypothetical protein